MSQDAPPQLDPLIHEAARLLIVSVLNQCAVASFGFLLQTTHLTRGNMSTHLAKLVDAGYIDEKKEIVGRRPRTEYSLTARGRTAFKRYRTDWQQVVDSTYAAPDM